MAEAPQRRGDERQIAQEAALWIMRREMGLTPAEQDEYSEWLAADPRHGAALARHGLCWQRLDKLAHWRPEHSAQPNPDLLSPPFYHRFRRFLPASAGLAAAMAFLVPVSLGMAVAAAFLLLWVSPRDVEKTDPPEAVVVAAVPPSVVRPIARPEGERILEDGSVVEVNRDAEIKVLYTASERRVVLERGEAHFDVRKDPARPFIVTARDVDVRAIGTAFAVRVEAVAVEVLVTHGRVQLDQAVVSTPVREGGPKRPVVPLDARQRAIVTLTAVGNAPEVATLSTGEIARVLAWHHRMLDFTAVPVGDVIVEFNRRNVVQLYADPELATLRISAAIRSDNIDGFVHLLQAGFGVRVERRGDAEIHLRHAAETADATVKR